MYKQWIRIGALILYGALLIEIVVFKAQHGLRTFGPLRPPGSPTAAESGHPLPPLRHPPQQPGRFVPHRANWIPFATLIPQLRGEPNRLVATVNLFANTVLFVPVGFLIPRIRGPMSWRISLLFALGVGITMEALEGAFHVGIVDVDDVILNALGVMAGHGVWSVLNPKRPDPTP